MKFEKYKYKFVYMDSGDYELYQSNIMCNKPYFVKDVNHKDYLEVVTVIGINIKIYKKHIKLIKIVEFNDLHNKIKNRVKYFLSASDLLAYKIGVLLNE